MRSTPATGSRRTWATSRPPTRRSFASEVRARSTVARGGRAPTCPSRNRPSPPRNDAERRAALWYRLRGYRVLDANCWLAGGELDLVLRRGRCVVFCEVKSKSGATFGDPLEMV